MRKLLTLLILFIVVASGSVLGMKRKYPFGDDGNWPCKRRKTYVPKKSKKYDRFKGEDGLYYCPDCDKGKLTYNPFLSHIRYHGHAGAQKGPKNTVYSTYKKRGGKYYCPNCRYRNKNYTSFVNHLNVKGHGGCVKRKKNKRKKKKNSQLNGYTLQTFTYLQEPDDFRGGAFYALFNFGCILGGDRDSRTNQELFDQQVCLWRNHLVTTGRDETDLSSLHLKQLIRKFDFFKASRKNTNDLTENCLFVDDYENLDEPQKMSKMTQAALVKVEKNHWVMLTIGTRNGVDLVFVVDSRGNRADGLYLLRLAVAINHVYNFFKRSLS